MEMVKMTSSVEYVYWTKSQETGQSKDLEVTESQLSSLFSFFTEDSSVRQGVPECFRFNITKISFFSSTIIIDTTSIISVIIFKRERDQLDGVVGVGHVVAQAQNPAPPTVHLIFGPDSVTLKLLFDFTSSHLRSNSSASVTLRSWETQNSKT